MLHAADHATYHRGQLNSMAKLAGGRPLPIMRYTWVLERPAGRRVTIGGSRRSGRAGFVAT